VIRGWVGYLGPCFDRNKVSGLYTRVRLLSLSLGFEEILSREEFRTHWQRAHARWSRERENLIDT
jgi:hypothetical protein